MLGFESADHPLDAWMARALELCADHGGVASDARDEAKGDAEGSWRSAFLQAPYLRDTMVAAGRAGGDLRDRDHVGPLRRLRALGARGRRGRRWARAA